MMVSIIIPHHNSSTLLKRLLDSIPAMEDIQVIVVDDHSSMNERDAVVCLKDNYQFEFYDNDSKTAGGARNTGLRHAVGKWIIFADADDYFESDIAVLLSKYKDSDKDIIFFNVTSRYTDSGELAYRNEHVQSIAKKAVQTGDYDYLRCCYTAPWGKMIKRSIIEENDIRFDEVVAGNDMWFSVNTGLVAKNVAYEDTPLYCITVTGNSITTTLSKDRFESRFLVTLRVNNLLRAKGKGKFQISVLYFIAKSYQFGLKYMLHVWWLCIKNRSNPFIGMQKLLNVGKVMKDRQNTNVSTR